MIQEASEVLSRFLEERAVPVTKMPKEAQDHKGEWLALSRDLTELRGWGKTPTEAIEMAEKAGSKEAVLFFMPKVWPKNLVI